MKSSELIQELQKDMETYGDEDLFVLVWGKKGIGHSLETSWTINAETWARVVDAYEASGDLEVVKRSIREDLVALIKKAIKN